MDIVGYYCNYYGYKEKKLLEETYYNKREI